MAEGGIQSDESEDEFMLTEIIRPDNFRDTRDFETFSSRNQSVILPTTLIQKSNSQGKRFSGHTINGKNKSKVELTNTLQESNKSLKSRTSYSAQQSEIKPIKSKTFKNSQNRSKSISSQNRSDFQSNSALPPSYLFRPRNDVQNMNKSVDTSPVASSTHTDEHFQCNVFKNSRNRSNSNNSQNRSDFQSNSALPPSYLFRPRNDVQNMNKSVDTSPVASSTHTDENFCYSFAKNPKQTKNQLEKELTPVNSRPDLPERNFEKCKISQSDTTSSCSESCEPKIYRKPPPKRRENSDNVVDEPTNEKSGLNSLNYKVNTTKKGNISGIGRLSNQKQKTTPNKPTVVYMKCSEEITQQFNISAYLNNRLGQKFQFEINEIRFASNMMTSEFSVKFDSKRNAIQAVNIINSTNFHSDTKIYCGFDNVELADIVDYNDGKRKKDLEIQMEEVRNRSMKMITEHNIKLSEYEKELSKIKDYVESHGFMPFDEFTIAESKTKAIKDKIGELKLQLQEFNMFVTELISKLQLVDLSKNYDKTVLDLRKRFGVECTRLSDCLPMYARRTEIIELVKNNNVSIIIGETGSGKSTQMTQFLYESGLAETGLIACTQPRKVAASNLAMHVAKQMNVNVGGLVGYQVGTIVKRNHDTRILYLTDHSLLNDYLKDSTLSKYSCIIIDEAHERSVYTDLLIGMLKNCLLVRPDLRIVITSATINPDIFVQFFGFQTPVLSVSGRTYPVEVIWKRSADHNEEFKDYQKEAVDKAVDIHKNEELGDVLVFVTTPLEAEQCCNMIQKHQLYNLVCLELHGKLRPEEQQKVFKQYPPNIRKIVFATNSAETSITIPGIKYVVDTGLVKEMNYDVKRSLNALNTNMVTQSSAEQRKGRAGRTGPGKCFRLYKEDTFNKMRPNAVPEILRIHLGHALLKLMELGVNPMQFDFVESPPEESIKAAMKSLEELKAADSGTITALGKWLAKLPLEPHFGSFLYNAIDEGLLMEAVIVASTCSSPGSMFFRGGSDQQKDKADKLKSRFCHQGGDLLTALQVYREWFRQPEQQKNKWCLQNSMNSKSLRGIRDTSKEIINILKKELKITVKENFKEDCADADSKLQRLLFKTFNLNLCHYLGHENAGYLFIAKEQQVHLFPSSALKALGSWPKWITFVQVMQTSRQFAMNVLPVPEEDVLQGIKEGWIKFDIDSVRKKKLKPVSTTLIGKSMYNDFVGPRHSFLRDLESEIQNQCNGSIAIIDANREEGTVKVFCIEEHSSKIVQNVEDYAQPLREKFKQEVKEECIGQEGSGVRVLLKAGGESVGILMADEYFTVQVTSSPDIVKNLTVHDVEIYFRQFGSISSSNQFNSRNKPSNLWGTVTFKDSTSAKNAIEQSKAGEISARLNKKLIAENSDSTFSAKLLWTRRRSRGMGFIEFKEVENVNVALRISLFLIAGEMSQAKPSKNNKIKPNEVFFLGLDVNVTEDVLRAEVARVMNLHPLNDIGNVRILRENVTDTKEKLDTMRNRISAQIKRFCMDNHKLFKLDFLHPRETSFNYIAYVNFVYSSQGFAACNGLKDTFVINGAFVSIVPQLKSNILVYGSILTAVKTQLDQVLNNLEENPQTEIKKTELRNGNLRIDISSEVIEVLAAANLAINNVIKGDVVDFRNENQVRQFFTFDGRNLINSIERKVGCTILLDKRTFTISIYGSKEQRVAAKSAIMKHLEEEAGRITKEIKLSGPGRPVGVMRALIMRYGCDLVALKKQTKLFSVDLSFRNHILLLVGIQETVNTATGLVDEVITSLNNGQILDSDDDDNLNCSTCWVPIDGPIYRLELCGHAYCNECLPQQIRVAVQDKDFPVLCCKEECGEPFVLQDFDNFCRMKHLDFSDFVSASVGCYVAKHKDKVHYCLTPDCEMVYKITKDGKPFRCALCSLTICTTCHIQYHHGMTCSMYKGTKSDGDYSIKSWMSADPSNRKCCPSCGTAIEKIDGCQHMNCTDCKMHICWRCMAFFDSSQKCYAHLAKRHGSFQ